LQVLRLGPVHGTVATGTTGWVDRHRMLGGTARCVMKFAHTEPLDRDAMAPLPPSEHSLDDPHRAVVACAKQAILDGDRSGALALLRVLLNNGPELAATLTPVLAEALIATARDETGRGRPTCARCVR
jgi:hypothetical protein